jgi:hypothetical protein
MHFLRYVQEGVSDGCGRDRQFPQPDQWNGMYPVHGLCQGMSSKGFMNISEGGKQTTGDSYYESCILMKKAIRLS